MAIKNTSANTYENTPAMIWLRQKLAQEKTATPVASQSEANTLVLDDGDDNLVIVNRYGLSSFQYGEVITADTGKLYLTAVNCAISIIKIHRDNTVNGAIGRYLDELRSSLGYAWSAIDENGKIHEFDGYRRQDTEDAIHDCLCKLYEFVGQEYSQEIQKQVRNAYGNNLNNAKRPADQLHIMELKPEIETADEPYRPIFSEENMNIRNKALRRAIYDCKFEDTDLEILLRISNGEKQTEIAKDLNTTQKTISVRYKKIIAKLQSVMVKA